MYRSRSAGAAWAKAGSSSSASLANRSLQRAACSYSLSVAARRIVLSIWRATSSRSPAAHRQARSTMSA